MRMSSRNPAREGRASWEFPSSSGTAVYRTVLGFDGKLLCNCKGWTMRRGDAPRHCKHTKKIAEGKRLVTRGEFVYLADIVESLAHQADDPHCTCNDCIEDHARRLEPSPAWRAGKNGEGQMHPSFSGQVPPDTAPAPMLASAMTDPVRGAAFDARYRDAWRLEEKLDGHRCVVVVRDHLVWAFSRPRAGAAANARTLPEHVAVVLRHLPDGIYDGELVAPGGKSWDVVVLGARLIFVAFDLLALGGKPLVASPYHERRRQLLACLAHVDPKQRGVSTVESVTPTWKAVEAIWKRGGEGAILKRVESRYTPNYRSPDWVKVKASRSATLTLTGFAAGKSGPYSVMELRDDAGVTTTVKTLGNALLRQISAAPESYLGRRVVITFQERTPTGTYRHGIFDHFAGDGE
jgi:ATP dependent DNA ligase-like protein